jgi:hypothetical protein
MRPLYSPCRTTRRPARKSTSLHRSARSSLGRSPIRIAIRNMVDHGSSFAAFRRLSASAERLVCTRPAVQRPPARHARAALRMSRVTSDAGSESVLSAQHPRRNERKASGRARRNEFEPFGGIELLSRANQAAAFLEFLVPHAGRALHGVGAGALLSRQSSFRRSVARRRGQPDAPSCESTGPSARIPSRALQVCVQLERARSSSVETQVSTEVLSSASGLLPPQGEQCPRNRVNSRIDCL